MDVDMANVLLAISKNKSLKHLSIGRTMLNMKAKHIATVVDAIVQILQDEECLLQTLIMPDCRLKSDLHNLLSALGDNKCLETLDISGNMIGDSGARLLAKALQINTKLKTIIYDRNNITLQVKNVEIFEVTLCFVGVEVDNLNRTTIERNVNHNRK